jgi:hypothetical protein
MSAPVKKRELLIPISTYLLMFELDIRNFFMVGTPFAVKFLNI